MPAPAAVTTWRTHVLRRQVYVYLLRLCLSPQLSPTNAVADELDSDDSGQSVPVVLRRKISRDRDPQRQWTRLSWQKHASSCVHLETFESFYHMTPDDFESLFVLLNTKNVDSRARKFVDLVLSFFHLS